MHPDKLTQLRRLLADGYTLLDIDSDHGCVAATLRRDGRIHVLRFHRSDAAMLLFGDPLAAWLRR